MGRRTSPDDARDIMDAQDLDAAVSDKRAGWRATAAKGRRRQRRYQKLLTTQLQHRSDKDDA